MKRTIYIGLISLVLNACTSVKSTSDDNYSYPTQSKKTRVELKNDILIPLLDSVILNITQCHLNEEKQSFYFQLTFSNEDDNLKLLINGNLWQSSMTSIALSVASQEYFYYADYLFLIIGEKNVREKFFTKTDEKRKIEMKETKQSLSKNISFLYSYSKGQFSLIENKNCQ